MSIDDQIEPIPAGEHETAGHDEATIQMAILEALADGVHPMNGEPLPDESVFKDAAVLAALAAGMAALQREQERLQRPSELPKNAGKPWDAEEDRRLADAFDAGTPINALAEEHGRTRGAIQSRLARLGKLVP